jgi:DNA (cytosine-5)-methyltransferase 1
MRRLRVLDLFSGIGGFSLGLERAGMQTVAFCEIEEFPIKVLNKNFPNVPVFNDIRKLTKDALNESGINHVDVVCGGFPCQPFSNAGKKKGREDNRDLWPEMFRVIKETKPTWVIGENVAGFIGMEFTRTKINLEGLGYSVQPFIIPACAVGAQHRRDRVWIVAHLDSDGREQNSSLQARNEDSCPRNIRNGKNEPASDIDSNGFSGKTNATKKENTKRNRKNNWWPETSSYFGNWWTDQSSVGRAVHGFSRELDKYRRHRVKALGNAVVPLIVEIIGKAIIEIESGH